MAIRDMTSEGEAFEVLATFLRDTLAERGAWKVQRVEVRRGEDRDGELMLEVIVHLDVAPRRKRWMYDLVTTANDLLREKGVNEVPFVDARLAHAS